MRKFVAVLCLSVVVAPTGSVLADSDGYYCVGSNFFAFEYNNPAIPDTHTISVLRFLFGLGRYYETEKLSIPDFQVHDIFCNEDSILLVGWKSVVEISWANGGLNSASTVERTREPGPPDFSGRSAPNSLFYGPKVEVVFTTKGSGDWFSITTKRTPVPEILCMDVISVTLHVGSHDVIDDTRILAAREVVKECGG